MVVRTTDRILVTEEQLQQAIGIVEDALAELGLAADIEVAEEREPEDEKPPPRTLVIAHVRTPVDLEVLLKDNLDIGERLHTSRLAYPAVPLVFFTLPAW